MSRKAVPFSHSLQHLAGGTDPISGDIGANARIGVKKAGGSTSKRRTVNLIEGSGIGLTVTDNAGAEQVDVTITATSAVVGPASATNTAVVLYDGTTGKLVKDSALTVAAGVMSGLTRVTPPGDFDIFTGGVAAFQIEATGSLASTVYLKAGKTGFRNSSPTYTVDISGNFRQSGAATGAGVTITPSYTLGNLSAVNVTPTRTGSATGYFAGLSFEPQLNTDTGVTVGDVWGITGNARMMGASNVSRAVGFRGTVQHTSSGTTTNAYGFKCDGITKSAGTITNSYGFYCVALTTGSTGNYGFYAESGMPNYFGGTVGVGVAAPTARMHLPAGTATASTAPLKLTSGVSLTTAEAGAIEFTTDDYFATITTGAARKALILDDGARLTSGKYPKASTNGRLIDGPSPLAGTKIYYASDSSGGAVTRKLTFTDGILTSET